MSNSQSDSTDPSAALAPGGGDNGALWSFTGVELIEISPEPTLLIQWRKSGCWLKKKWAFHPL